MVNSNSILFPNKFKSKNTTFCCEFESEKNIYKLYDEFTLLPDEINSQLRRIKKIYITFSEAISDINNYRSIKYSEVIIKVPINYLGVEYIFPIATYVNNRFSLFRGYLLGFNKYFNPTIRVDNNYFYLLDECVNLNLKLDESQQIISNKEKKDDLFCPFLIHRHHNVVEKVDEIVSLSVSNYNMVKYTNIGLDGVYFGNILNNRVLINNIIQYDDEFSLNGVKTITQ